MFTKTENNITAFCVKHNYNYTWENTKGDTKRAAIDVQSYADLLSIAQAANRLKNVKITSWHTNGGGVFSGVIWLWDKSSYEHCKATIEKEQTRNYNWCMMYHNLIKYGASRKQAAAQAELHYKTPV